MGRNFNIGTTPINDKEYTCGWKGCKKGVHEFPITYPNQNKGETSTKTSIDDDTILRPHQLLQQVGVLLGPKSEKDPKIVARTNIDTYKVAKHHVIPGEVFVGECKLLHLKHNLKLLGWDMNHGYLNGLSLPMQIQSAAWHGLQRHDGGHDPYTRLVEKSLKNIDKICKTFCHSEDEDINQDTLEELIRRSVETWKDRIIKWEVLIHADSLINVALELNKPERYIRLSSRTAFPGDTNRIYKSVPKKYLM